MALSVLPVALTVLLGFLYSAPLFVMDPLRHYMNWGAVFMICVILLCGIGLVPSIFLRNTNFMLRLMRRPQIQSSAETSKLVFASGLIILRFIILGLGFFLLAKGFTDVSWKHLFFFSMVSVASSVAGFLAFFTPAGLGVREGVILLLLGSTLGSSDIAIIAVSLRLIQVLVDLTVGGIGISFLRKIGLRT